MSVLLDLPRRCSTHLRKTQLPDPGSSFISPRVCFPLSTRHLSWSLLSSLDFISETFAWGHSPEPPRPAFRQARRDSSWVKKVAVSDRWESSKLCFLSRCHTATAKTWGIRFGTERLIQHERARVDYDIARCKEN